MPPILPSSSAPAPSVWARRVFCALTLLVVSLPESGCRPAAAQPAESNFTPATPPAPPPRPPARHPSSWTDAVVIDELEKNCAFDPDRLTPEQSAVWFDPNETNALSCQVGFDQSCVYDPCFTDTEDRCKPRCAKQCRSCGAACATACETCKRACKPEDKDCRRRCATTCATCRQACVRTLDRCSTGTCTNEYKACRSKLKADWQNNRCVEVCRVYADCQRPCLRKHEKKGDGYEACTKPCYPPKEQRNGCNMLLCPGDFSMGIDPMDWKR